MAKGRVRMGSKNFFTLVVLSVSVLSLMFVTYASQQRTSTESDAAGYGCAKNPALTVIDSVGHTNNVVYTLRLKNRDSMDPDLEKENCKPDTYTLSRNLPGSNWNLDFLDGREFTVKEGMAKSFRVKVSPPSNARNGEYTIKVTAQNTRDGSNASDTKSFGYIVTGNNQHSSRDYVDNDPNKKKDLSKCTIDPTIKLVSGPNISPNGYIANYKMRVKNNCDSGRVFSVSVRGSLHNGWRVGSEENRVNTPVDFSINPGQSTEFPVRITKKNTLRSAILIRAELRSNPNVYDNESVPL